MWINVDLAILQNPKEIILTDCRDYLIVCYELLFSTVFLHKKYIKLYSCHSGPHKQNAYV